METLQYGIEIEHLQQAISKDENICTDQCFSKNGHIYTI